MKKKLKVAEEAPVRLCCSQRHFGVICPDGLVMCQLCFKRVPIDSLHDIEDGAKEDICKECAKLEEAKGK